MSPVEDQVADIVATVLERLKAKATSPVVRAKLEVLDKACRHVVIKARRRPTVPDVLSAYAMLVADERMAIAEQSIRNKCGGANPYNEIYRTWVDAAEALHADRLRRSRRMPPTDDLVDEDDLVAISDDTLRHQVRLLLAQNRNLRNERDILKRTTEATVVNITSVVPADMACDLSPPKRMTLLRAELDVLQDFVNPLMMRDRGLRIADDGTIETLDGREMSDPGIVQILTNIIADQEQ